MASPRIESGRTRQATIFAAFAAFAIANLIHNNLGVDPAIAPSLILISLYAWRPARPLLWAAALFIALPSFAFLKLSALTHPTELKPFLNHLALLSSGALAVASFALGLRRITPAQTVETSVTS